ncbi:hypothetical protein [Aquisalimonas asiatica]|uniref:Uncharacterized protein n=1 Tax=Aquisalimonas asiatica TaxID=406100 RepID=A0A1H8Q0A4_9GAMM|nr:hypothetical protein [Aquisalimonas asiatica]SEO47662.1 hypothetical protein SAMN04488052_101270 [Aquisalimonas asiatica]
MSKRIEHVVVCVIKRLVALVLVSILVIPLSGCATMWFSDRIDSLDEVGTAFDGRRDTVTKGEYRLDSVEDGYRLRMRFGEALRSRRDQPDWLNVDIDITPGSEQVERYVSMELSEADEPLGSGETAILVDQGVEDEDEPEKVLQSALDRVDPVAVGDLGYVTPVLVMSVPHRTANNQMVRGRILVSDDPDKESEEVASASFRYFRGELVGWHSGIDSPWTNSDVEHELEGRHPVHPGVYSVGYAATVPVDVMLAPVYVVGVAVLGGALIIILSGG